MEAIKSGIHWSLVATKIKKYYLSHTLSKNRLERNIQILQVFFLQDLQDLAQNLAQNLASLALK